MIQRLSKRLAAFICRHPWLVILVGLALAAGGGYLTTKIKVHSSFSDLLPDQSPAVRDLESISKRIGGRGTLMVQVEGENLQAMQRFADALVARIKAYPKDEVLFVEYKVDAQKEFFDRNKFLYVPIDELKKLRDEVQRRVDDEIAKANPFFVDLSSDEEKAAKKKKDAEFDLKKKRAEYEDKLHKFDKYRDGYLTNEAGTALVIVIKTPGSNTGVEFATRFTKKVEDEIAAIDPKKFDPSLAAYLAGELKDLPDEYHALTNDILVVSNLCTGLILLAVFLYFRSLKMLIILTVSLVEGLLVTFGITYLHIGYLTQATAFLAAIVAGNGINFSIYFLARYLEERTGEGDIADRVARTLNGTLVSVSTAALAAGTAYASLMLTEFKGFNQFGFIGGVGMVVCLLYGLIMNAAIVVVVERRFPFKALSRAQYERGRVFSAATALLVVRHPRKVFWIGVTLLVASGISLAFFLRDPFEYDFRKLRNQYAQKGTRSNDAEKIIGQRSSPHIFLADDVAQVPKIEKALAPFMKDAPEKKNRAIKAIRSVYDYIPGTVAEQREKIAVLGEIRELIRGRAWKSLSKADREEIDRLTPPEDLAPVTLDGLPEELVRPYVELDGTRGTLIYVDQTGSVWNGPSIFRFSRVIREVKLDDGKVLRSSGKVVIFNDMIRHVQTEGPWATLIAFSAVMVLLVAVYRNRRDVFVLATAMTSGVVLMLGATVALDQKINFLNYIAIPISFGIGVDYTVNLYSRFKQEGPGSIEKVLRSTGGAVMITSATTILGFGAMWFSINGAINSFATLAVVGEVTCLLTATVLAPAAFALFMKGLPPKA